MLYGSLELLFDKNVPEYVTSALKKGYDVTIDPVALSCPVRASNLVSMSGSREILDGSGNSYGVTEMLQFDLICGGSCR